MVSVMRLATATRDWTNRSWQSRVASVFSEAFRKALHICQNLIMVHFYVGKMSENEK